MPRFIKKTVILAKIEAVPGTDAAPTGALNAIKAFDMSITPLEMSSINLPFMASWFGAAVSLPGAAYSKCTFSVAFSGAGAAATAPAWGALLVGSAHAETTGLVAPNRVEYLPATDGLKTMTIYWHDDGLLHKMVGAMGMPKLSAKSGDVAKLTFDFIGLESTPTAVGNATPVLTAWKDPVAIVKANVTDIQLACTYATGALSGGTSYNTSGLTLDWGNVVEFNPLLSTEDVSMSDRKIKGTFSAAMTAAQEAAMIAAIKTGTTQGLGFVIGNTSGNKLMLHASAMRLKTHKKEEIKGQRMVGFDFELDPVAGNDELRIVSL
ncbi:phage tail tube protein [Rhodoferax sp.]|uniref:phage tail tube protein n=1 Tax=Rhodoferax sp. TaxID=50421 RepID=UPI00260F648A|nr:phage tail tube protein [Rhodoferax sp.]MDD5479648.1 phage tail tube protein [Rhodoferax sp.]